MTEGFTIKSIDREDKEEVLELTEDIWQGHDYIPDVIDEWIENGGFISGKVDGEMVAVAKHTEQREDVYWLEGLRVHPDHQGKGYGRDMMEEQIDLLEEKGYKALRFLTSQDKSPVKKVVSERGFEVKQSYHFLRLDVDGLMEKKESIERYRENLDGIVKEDRKEKVKDFVFSSEEYEKYEKEFLASWTCKKIDEDLLEKEVEKRNCFTIHEDGDIDALAFFYHYEPFESLSIPFISGSKEGIERLIDYGLVKSIEENFARYSIKTASDKIASIAEERGIERSDHGKVLLFEKR
ncbi:MAG: GNAT family N-acetyltransferase [Candidatus Thermoplasmatota archaeon]